MSEKVRFKFDAHGLLPAICQDADSGVVLMLAYMNEETLNKTLATGQTWFYSRSRKSMWRKGESSGHTQQVVGVSYDCDADTILVKVRQTGGACHEGYRSCFFRRLNPDGTGEITDKKIFDPDRVYEQGKS